MTYNKRPNRSDHYQFRILETVCSNDMMESFSNSESIYNRLNPFEYNEDLLDLEDQLKIEFWRIVEDSLTDRQKEVIKLYADGYTQMEIAKMLGVNQSSITKSLRGNIDYRNGRTIYGGTEKKLKRIIETDPKVKEILDKINEIRTNKW